MLLVYFCVNLRKLHFWVRSIFVGQGAKPMNTLELPTVDERRLANERANGANRICSCSAMLAERFQYRRVLAHSTLVVVFHRTRERVAFICERNYPSRLGRNGFSATFTETDNDVGCDGGWTVIIINSLW